MAGYTIGSEKGKQIANGMKAGETYKASDGSTWTKNSDGTVSVTTKSGGYTANALPGASMPTGYQGSATGINVYTQEQADWQKEMNDNSKAWYGATPENQEQLSERNKELAALLGGSVMKDENGYWVGDAEKPFTYVPTFSYDTSSKPTYESQYDPQIDELLNQILTREDFSYDVNADPLFAQYKQQYLREGNRAMNDTLASAASNAGGMNSYAVTAAQQANNYYNSQLTDMIPELYQLAYGMYLDDKASDVENLGLLQQMDNTQYGRYRDTMSDWMNDRNFAYQQYRDAIGDYTDNRDFEYGVGRDQIEDDRYNTEWEYTTSINDKETAYNQALDFMAMGVMPSADLLAKAGISTAEAQTYVNRVIAEMNKVGSSGGGGGSKKSSGSGSKKTTGSAQEDFTPLNSVDQLGAAAQKQVKSLSMMKDSMSNMQKDADGMYPVEKSILILADQGTITDQEAEYMLRYFGYDSSKHYG